MRKEIILFSCMRLRSWEFPVRLSYYTHRTNSNLLPNRQRGPPSRAGTTPRHRCVIHSHRS